MKTARTSIASEKDERAAWLQRRRNNHHRALETLARQVGSERDGLKLWRQLRRLENHVHKYSTAYCNGEIEVHTWEAVKSRAELKLADIFGGYVEGVFINSDPRGYALKLDNEQVQIPQGMETDWGGYGILAAEIN